MLKAFGYPSKRWWRCGVMVVVVSVFLTACAMDQQLQKVDEQHSERRDEQQGHRQHFEKAMRLQGQNKLIHHIDAPWVVGAPVPLADHVVLPRALQKKVDTHLMFSDGGLSLEQVAQRIDRKSTRLNSSHVAISYAVFCLKKKKTND